MAGVISPTPKVAILDYGSGNLRSAVRALVRTGADVVLTADIDLAAQADGLVVPGVGAFATCMAGLSAVGGDDLIRRRVLNQQPVLGICVGFQVLFSGGVEHGVQTAGVGIFSGEVQQLDSPRLPHMGWNTVRRGEGSRLFAEGSSDTAEGISGTAEGSSGTAEEPGEESERFYFVHSYGVPAPPAGAVSGAGQPQLPGQVGETILSTAEHGGNFIAGIECGTVWGTQFHPEKSADAGARLLQRWVDQLS